jgi:hypothetical protein
MATHIHPPPRALDEEGRTQRHDRRRRQLTGLVLGAIVGWLAGFLLQYLVGITHVTGSASNPFAVAFGLPIAMAIAFGLFGLMLATTREVEVVDAPVRMGRFRRLGRAATSERGQLPGSPVPPRTPDDAD